MAPGAQLRLAAIALSISLAATANASPLQMFGFGGRSPAIGGTGVASTDDFDAVYLNPAGLASLTGRRLSVGTLFGDFRLDGVDRPIDNAFGFEAGITVKVPLGGSMADRVGFGAGFYFPPTVITRVRAPRPGTPYFALLESRAQTIGVQVGLGFAATDSWSIGAGVLALGAFRSKLDVISDRFGRIAATTDAELVNDIAPILGSQWRPRPDLNVGATLRFRSQSSYTIRVDTDLGDDIPLGLPPLLLQGVAQYDPMILATEAAWQAGPHLLVTGHVAWERWSAYPLPSENPVVGAEPQQQPGFHDTLVPRVGVEWTGASGDMRWALRGGYFFAWSPAPEMTGQQALLDNHRHVATAGVGLSMPEASVPVHVDLWFQGHLLVSRRHHRPDDLVIDTSGAIFAGGLVIGVDID